VIGYTEFKNLMRITKKHSQATPPDTEFEQLYRGIPAGYGDRPGISDAPQQADPSAPAPRRHPVRTFFKRLLIICLIVALLAGGWVGFKFVANGVRVFGWDGLVSLFTTRQLKGEADGRVTILLAGNSADDPNHAGAALTDSIMVVSLDTNDKTAYMLSIPRDLYINIPDYGYAKINEAYQHGESSGFAEAGYANGGMGLLEKTVAEHFGVTINYYALVNYTALRQAVDAVGGITITVNSSDPRGLYDPSPDLNNNRQPLVNLPNGAVTLDGVHALGLARARGHAKGAYGFAASDFARTEHQRQILLGLKDKAGSVGTLSNPIKVGELFDAFGTNVVTDLQLGESRRLYSLLKDTPSGAVASVGLNDANGSSLLKNYTTRSGQSALVPRLGVDDYTDIKAYLQSL
jgi:polyisoprenyl-teichoic acid--peptidoglycan teichoic acid transferase